MAETFSKCIEEQRAAIRQLRTASQTLRSVFSAGHWSFEPRIHYYGHDFNLEDKSIESMLWVMNCVAWAVIVDKIGLRKILSSKAQRELSDALDVYKAREPGTGGSLPWLSAEAIQAVLTGWRSATDEFLYELVHEEYDYWKPSAKRKFKSDTFEKLAERVINTYMVSSYGSKFSVNHSARSHVISLDNIFHLLDGAGPLPGHNGPLVDAIEVCSTQVKRGETEYFEFKCYLNGNLHLRFKRLDLLDKFNALAGRNYLGQAKHGGNANDSSATRSLSTL